MQRTKRSFRFLGLAPLALALLCLTGGCDKSSDATPPTDTAGEENSCLGYKPTDGCMNDSNFAQCKEMEAKCPGKVAVLESCPLQFACS